MARAKTNLMAILAVAGAGLLAWVLLRKKPAEAGETVTENLAVGLQEVVFQGETRPIAGQFAGLEDKVEAVWRWDEANQVWLGYSPSAPDWANDLLTLEQGEVYWINALSECQWTYNLSYGG